MKSPGNCHCKQGIHKEVPKPKAVQKPETAIFSLWVTGYIHTSVFCILEIKLM